MAFAPSAPCHEHRVDAGGHGAGREGRGELRGQIELHLAGLVDRAAGATFRLTVVVESKPAPVRVSVASAALPSRAGETAVSVTGVELAVRLKLSGGAATSSA